MSTLSSALYSSYEYLSSFGVQEVVNPSTPLVDYIVDKMVPYLPPDAAAYISNPSNYPEMLEQVLISFLLLVVSFIALGLPFNLSLLLYPEGRKFASENREVLQHKQFELLWAEISSCEHSRLVLPPTCRRIPNYQPPESKQPKKSSASDPGVEGDESTLGRIGRAVSVFGDVVETKVRNLGSRKKKSTRDVREDSIKEGTGGDVSERTDDSENNDKGSPDYADTDKASPDKTSPDKTSPDKTSPDKTSPDKTSPDKTSPDKTSPEKLVDLTPTKEKDDSDPADAPSASSGNPKLSNRKENDVFSSPKPSPALLPVTPTTSLSVDEMDAIQLTSAKLGDAGGQGNGKGKGSASESMNFFEAASSHSAIRKMSQPTVLPDNNGYVFDGIGEDRTPLVVFVNSKSGGNQGRLLISQLRRVLNPIQVHDLASGPPDRVLSSFSALPKSRILVCGGDGTVAWIMDALEKLDMKESRKPPIAILPLGTGNDLARIHGWGGGYNNESLLDVLKEVGKGYVSLCDRWRVEVEKKGKTSVKVFNNYFGIGADAQAALDFHSLRETKPELFFSRITNKVWYAVLGAEDIFKASCDDIPQKIHLKADGVEVDIPDDCQGLIFLNIDSYAGGIKLWAGGTYPGENEEKNDDIDEDDEEEEEGVKGGERRQRFGSMDSQSMPRNKEELENSRKNDSSCQDGMIDIIAIKGCLHLGQINVGLSRAQRLCQCKELEMTTERKYPCQLDGEPWGQSACKIRVTRKEESATMLHRAETRTGGDVATEMVELLDWAEEKGILNKKQHQKITKEFSRRIEARNRTVGQSGSRENLLSYGAKAMTKGFNMPFLRDMQQTPNNKRKKEKEQELQFLDYELGEHKGFENDGDDAGCAIM